jgi:transposase InsO family protein
MAWRVNNVIEQRKLFIKKYLENNENFSHICEEFGVSRPTGYKWLQRYVAEGEKGLENRSKARLTQALKTEGMVENSILDVKHLYPDWGSKKIYAYLNKHTPGVEWPSKTTVGNILARNGLVSTRKKKRRYPANSTPLSHCEKPNDVWCADFKGWFQTKDRIKCDPFTVTDACSRFILYCSKLHSGKEPDVWNAVEKLFYENGLPLYFRTDNGPPFASIGAGRLSALSIKLIKAGVTPEWIDPGKPYQNGRHERMHLTLKKEGTYPLQLTLKEQEMKFVEFLKYYNCDRPHEAINFNVPADIYIRSERYWNGKFCPPEYGKEYLVKRVRAGGQVFWNGRNLFIGKTLANENIGFKEGDDEWVVYYGPVLLGTIDLAGCFHIPHNNIRPKRKYTERCY